MAALYKELPHYITHNRKSRNPKIRALLQVFPHSKLT